MQTFVLAAVHRGDERALGDQFGLRAPDEFALVQAQHRHAADRQQQDEQVDDQENRA
jgi:hypothetical protein